jgi:hypothetical protein
MCGWRHGSCNVCSCIACRFPTFVSLHYSKWNGALWLVITWEINVLFFSCCAAVRRDTWQLSRTETLWELHEPRGQKKNKQNKQKNTFFVSFVYIYWNCVNPFHSFCNIVPEHRKEKTRFPVFSFSDD